MNKKYLTASQARQIIINQQNKEDYKSKNITQKREEILNNIVEFYYEQAICAIHDASLRKKSHLYFVPETFRALYITRALSNVKFTYYFKGIRHFFKSILYDDFIGKGRRYSYYEVLEKMAKKFESNGYKATVKTALVNPNDYWKEHECYLDINWEMPEPYVVSEEDFKLSI